MLETDPELQRKQAFEELHYYKELVQTSGWKLFHKHLMDSMAAEMTLAIASKDAHDMAKHVGAMAAFKTVIGLPDAKLASLAQSLQQYTSNEG